MTTYKLIHFCVTEEYHYQSPQSCCCYLSIDWAQCYLRPSPKAGDQNKKLWAWNHIWSHSWWKFPSGFAFWPIKTEWPSHKKDGILRCPLRYDKHISLNRQTFEGTAIITQSLHWLVILKVDDNYHNYLFIGVGFKSVVVDPEWTSKRLSMYRILTEFRNG